MPTPKNYQGAKRCAVCFHCTTKEIEESKPLDFKLICRKYNFQTSDNMVCKDFKDKE